MIDCYCLLYMFPSFFLFVCEKLRGLAAEGPSQELPGSSSVYIFLAPLLFPLKF